MYNSADTYDYGTYYANSYTIQTIEIDQCLSESFFPDPFKQVDQQYALQLNHRVGPLSPNWVKGSHCPINVIHVGDGSNPQHFRLERYYSNHVAVAWLDVQVSAGEWYFECDIEDSREFAVGWMQSESYSKKGKDDFSIIAFCAGDTADFKFVQSVIPRGDLPNTIGVHLSFLTNTVEFVHAGKCFGSVSFEPCLKPLKPVIISKTFGGKFNLKREDWKYGRKDYFSLVPQERQDCNLNYYKAMSPNFSSSLIPRIYSICYNYELDDVVMRIYESLNIKLDSDFFRYFFHSYAQRFYQNSTSSGGEVISVQTNPCFEKAVGDFIDQVEILPIGRMSHMAQFTQGLIVEIREVSSRKIQWHEKYVTAYRMAEYDDMTKGRKNQALKKIYDEFLEVAKSETMYVIDHLINDESDCKKLSDSVGGIAGGEKYIRKGILIKVSRDVKLSNTFMYGGRESNDSFAGKAASQELLGALQFSRGFSDSLIIIPAQTIVDYKGYRCVCVPVLPIGKDTICYGSCDAGKTIHSKYDFISQRMAAVAKELHLASHFVKDTGGKTMVELHTGGDVELHFGRDGNFYLVDLARSFPPECPFKAEEFHGNEYQKSRSVFFRMLRPELLQAIKLSGTLPPVSSDSLSNWGDYDHKKYDSVTRLASDLMFRVQIPALAKFLDGKTHFSSNVSLYFHQYGVNMRHIALVAWISQSSQVRSLLSNEMITRTLKRMIRVEMRKQHQNPETSISWDQFRHALVTDLMTFHPDSDVGKNVQSEYGSQAFAVCQDNRSNLNVFKCIDDAASLCGLQKSSSGNFRGFPHAHVTCKIVPFVEVASAEVFFYSDPSMSNKDAWISELVRLENSLRRDFGNQLIKDSFVNYSLRFFKFIFEPETSFCVDEVVLESLLSVCASLLTEPQQVKELMKSTQYKRSWWNVIFNSLNYDCLLLYSFLYSVTFYCPDDSNEIQKYALKVLDSEHIRNSFFVQEGSREEVLFFWMYVLMHLPKRNLEIRRSLIPFFDVLEEWASRSSLQELYRLGLGLKFEGLEHPGYYFSGLLESQENLTIYIDRWLSKYSIDYESFLVIACHKELHPRNHYIWNIREQAKMFELLEEKLGNISRIQNLLQKALKTFHDSINGQLCVDEKTESKTSFPVTLPYIYDESTNSLTAKVQRSERCFVDQLTSFLSNDCIGRTIKELSIVHLNSIAKGIGDVGAEILSDFLSLENCAVTKIELSRNHIGDVGCRALAQSLEKNLSVLNVDLQWNNITNASLTYLNDLMTRNNVLKTFNVSFNSIKPNQVSPEMTTRLICQACKEDSSVHCFSMYHSAGPIIYRCGQMNHIDRKLNGHGVSFSPDGKKYDGEWKNDKEHGYGVLLYVDGDKYVGTWKDGLKHGHGVFYGADGGKYDGEWKDGKQSSHGVYYYANGNQYDGTWKDGKRHGNGVLLYSDGDKYDGEWKEGEEDGHGVYYFVDGDIYDGQWKDGKENGHGVYYAADGDVYDGEWKDGKKHGHAVYQYADGSKFEGEWEDDQHQVLS